MVEEQRQRGASSPHVWVSTSYFAEGFPYSVVHQLAEVLFKESGASLQAIGLTSLFHLPWNLKFLWGPLLDAFSTKRQWLVSVEIAITGVIVALAAATQASNVLAISSVLFIALALLAATHDIAIDGYYLEALDESGQSRFVGYRAAAYRIAMMVVAGPLLWCISRSGWALGFMLTAAVMAALLGYHALFLPRVETPRQPFVALLRAALRLRFVHRCSPARLDRCRCSPSLARVALALESGASGNFHLGLDLAGASGRSARGLGQASRHPPQAW